MRYLVILALLVVVALMALPGSAAFLDSSPSTENLILPVCVGLTLAVGAGAGVVLLPGERSAARRAATGVALGAAAVVLAVGFFFLLVSGVGGA